MDLELAKTLSIEGKTKIVLLVMDGLGGLPHPDTGRTELESAYTPHLDMLAKQSLCGFTVPVSLGVTPGSGPGHLGLFGYDPLKYNIGRGVLEAAGVDFALQAQDVAARGNFCTVDESGTIIDRRAGRIDTDRSARLVEDLRKVRLDGVQLFVEPVREHRFVLVLRGDGLSEAVADTDPQAEGKAPITPRALLPEGERTATLLRQFVSEARAILTDKNPANMLVLRGLAKRPNWPAFPDVFRLKAAAVAYYPMYRGLARLVGMQTLPAGPNLEDSLATVQERWNDFDFFFVHYKYTDSAGEDGDFEAKVGRLEEVDAVIPRLVDMAPDVLMVAGDHSTPSVLAAHSWHPVPFMLQAKWIRADECDAFNETRLLRGSLGTIPATEAMPLAMAHARRFAKYGA